MKRIIASASMVAVGTAGLHAQYAPGLSRTQTTKPWSVSATARGFYDDNYLTAPSRTREESWGFEISPSVGLNIVKDQTYIGASYRYSAKYFEARDNDEFDHLHELNLEIAHRLSERYDVEFNDTFVYTEEPELIDPNLGAPVRDEAGAYRNTAELIFNAILTERLGVAAGYQNTFVDYEDDGDGSRSALLDRVEHLIRLDGRYQVREQTTGVLGTRFGIVDYTGDELLTVGGPAESDSRNNYSFFFYGGADHQFTSRLNASARVGIQYTDFDNAGEDTTSPFVELNLTHTYAEGSYARLGARHFRNPTDVISLDQESTSIFGELNHKITAKLTGNVIAQYQNSEFNDGAFDGDADNFFLLGASLDYAINQFLSAEVSYNLDRLNSDLPNRSFTRNRILFGFRASY